MRSTLFSLAAVFALMVGFINAPMFHLHELEEADHARTGTVHSHLPAPADETHAESSHKAVDIIIAPAAPSGFFPADLTAAEPWTPITPISHDMPGTIRVRVHDPPLIGRSNPRSPPA